LAYESQAKAVAREDVSHEARPERSAAEIKEAIIQKLIAWGVKIDPRAASD
jgi:hypothetical protein